MTHLNSLFIPYQVRIEEEIDAYLSSLTEKTALTEAVAYALKSGGKRIRPLLVYAISEGIGKECDVVDAALSVEFFHTASLIVDDLPCMDNDDVRRDKPSLHRAFSEPVALLASYALITAAFEKIHKNGERLSSSHPDSEKAVCIALGSASFNAGILGATGGQYLDLFPQERSLELIKRLIYQKTVTLFEVAFVLGWVFGGGVLSRLNEVKKAAYHLGMAFQIADDIADFEQDKAANKWMSSALFLGKDKAKELFLAEMDELKRLLKLLNVDTPLFQALQQKLYASTE